MATKSKRLHPYHASFDLDNKEDARAWEYLKNLDQTKYKNISQAIVTAVNAYFGQELPSQKQGMALVNSSFDSEQMRQILREEMPNILAMAIQRLLLQGIQPVAPLEPTVVPKKYMDEEPKEEIAESTLAFLMGE